MVSVEKKRGGGGKKREGEREIKRKGRGIVFTVFTTNEDLSYAILARFNDGKIESCKLTGKLTSRALNIYPAIQSLISGTQVVRGLICWRKSS